MSTLLRHTLTPALLALLLGGCAHRTTVTLAPEPVPSALTPAQERLSDVTLQADLARLTRLDKEAAQLPAQSPGRAERTVLLEAVRTEYLAGSREPWLDETVARLSGPVTGWTTEPAEEGTARGLADWIAHVRHTRGFRAALPLLVRADSLPAVSLAASGPDARPNDCPDRIWTAQRRLAALHDDRKLSVQGYAWSKAQAWLDFAADAYAIRDRSGIVGDVLAQAEKIMAQLEAPAGDDRDRALTEAALANPRFGAAARAPSDFRTDLWQLAARHRPTDLARHLENSSAGLATLARLEVALLQAAYEHGDGGSRSSRPYQQAASRLAAKLPSSPP